jgi:tetratricopeptide (TPR) repeat protein
VHLAAGRLDAAQQELNAALAMLQGIRPNHRYVLTVKRGLAETLSEKGDFAAADSLLKGVLELERQSLPKAHVDLAHTLHAYGALQLGRGDATGAERFLREALTIRHERLGGEHWLAALTESLLGSSLSALGRSQEAQPMLQHSLQVLRTNFGDDDARTRRASERRKNARTAG